MRLNQFIDLQIGFGRYQIQAFVILCFVGINDGVQVILISLLNPVLKTVNLNFTSSLISLMTTLFFIGIVMGALSSGKLSDNHGRRQIIIFGCFLQIFTGIMFYLSKQVLTMLFIRFIYGFAFGFSNSVISTMFIEICPTKFRGKCLVLLNFFLSLGKIYGIVLGYIFMRDDLAQTNWKNMMLCGCLPSFVAIFGCFFVLYQSPRYLLVHKKNQQAFAVLNSISRQNNKDESKLLKHQDETEITSQFLALLQNYSQATYTSLFSSQYFKSTIAILLIWFIANFCYYTQLTIEAMHISNNSSHINIHNYFITVIGQMPCIFVAIFLVDTKSFGRKKSLFLFQLLGSVSHLLFALTKSPIFGFSSSFFMKNVFIVGEVMTAEIFDTRVRMWGYNFCSGIGKMGAVVMPYIVFSLDEWCKASVYILLSTLMFSAALIVQYTLQETMHKNLN